jgi:predicted DsbA family dithiol-disulfide isomerase
MTDLQIDIWSDVMCPWCAIGITQLREALAEMEGDVDAELRAMPFELNPDAPPEGKSQAAPLAEVYGRSAEELDQMRAQMEKAGREAGFSMDYTGEGDPPEPMMWNTFDAHKLLRWALVQKGWEAQMGLKLALFRAHFNERRNIGDREVLAEIAAEQGFDRDAARAALEEEELGIAVRVEEKRALENGISSVPTFVVNGRYILQGAAEPERFKQALYQLASMEAQA